MTENNALPRSTPEAQAIPTSAILAFITAVENNIQHLHSFMLLRHGQVVAEGWWQPYAPQERHMLFSLSKSFTSTAIGLAVDEGRLSVDDLVLSFFPTEAPAEVNNHLATMQVRHLLSMSTGHTEDTLTYMRQQHSKNWVKDFLAQPPVHPPGTHFLYHNGASYMLAAILHKLTGQTLTQYLQPRLFTPLGIKNLIWESNAEGLNLGFTGLNITTEDIARFGQLYLQKGQWQGQQLVPAAWVKEATSAHVSNGNDPNSDWAQGYGYQFWRCRHQVYRGDGAFGQYCLVMEAQDAVLAMTSGVRDMQPVLNLVWEHLLPAMEPAPQEKLAQKLAQLSLPPVQAAKTSPLAAQVSGQTYTFADNEFNISQVSFAFGPDQDTLIIHNAQGQQTIISGHGVWVKGETTLGFETPRAVAVSGGWTSEDTYLCKFCMYETPYCPSLSCHFEADEVTLEITENVSFGPLEHPPLIGKRAISF